MAKAKAKKKDVKKVIDEWRGKGKINILDICRVENGYRVRFESDEGRDLQWLDFDNLEEADEFSKVFGGKNNYTVAANAEYLDLRKWDSESLFNLGHKVNSISFRGLSRANSITNVKHPVPDGCGVTTIISKQAVGPNQMTRTISYRQEFRKTLSFRDETQIDALVEWMNTEFGEFDIHVMKAVTENLETGDCIEWNRKKVGDGTKSMELRAEKINGTDYKECRFMDIVRLADAMTEKTCRRYFKERGKAQYDEGCQSAVEEGRKKL